MFFVIISSHSYDVVTVGSGLDPSDLSTVYALVSGSRIPDNIVLASDTAWVQFTSDSSVNERGFSIKLQNQNGSSLEN